MILFAVLIFITVKISTTTKDGTFREKKEIHVNILKDFSQKSTKQRPNRVVLHQDCPLEPIDNDGSRKFALDHSTGTCCLVCSGIAAARVVFANDTKQERQLTMLRRSMVSVKADDKCYRNFFVGNMPPTGFKSSTGKAKNIRYICQQPSKYKTPFFSTMFDLNYGIPIYAAYVVKQQQASKFGSASRKGQKFRPEPGIPANNQESDKMYYKTGKPSIHKGHLVPAETYSFSEGHLRSTFTYTNAVPQYGTFNSGQWAKYEKRIRNYATKVCSAKHADLYLLTGISEFKIQLGQGNLINTLQPRGQPKRMRQLPKIVIPNSMWTAGCCVRGTRVFGSFAVIGNNTPRKEKIEMSQVTVDHLARIIGNVDLFPGNDDCHNRKIDVTI